MPPFPTSAGPENKPPLPCLPCLLFFWFVIAHIAHYTAAAGAGTSGPPLCAAPGRVRLTQLRWAPFFFKGESGGVGGGMALGSGVCVRELLRTCAYAPTSVGQQANRNSRALSEKKTDRSIACACHRRTTADETTREAKKKNPITIRCCRMCLKNTRGLSLSRDEEPRRGGGRLTSARRGCGARAGCPSA